MEGPCGYGAISHHAGLALERRRALGFLGADQPAELAGRDDSQCRLPDSFQFDHTLYLENPGPAGAAALLVGLDGVELHRLRHAGDEPAQLSELFGAVPA